MAKLLKRLFYNQELKQILEYKEKQILFFQLKKRINCIQ